VGEHDDEVNRCVSLEKEIADRLAVMSYNERLEFLEHAPEAKDLRAQGIDLRQALLVVVRHRVRAVHQAGHGDEGSPASKAGGELPGAAVSGLARLVLTKRAYEAYVAPAIADMQYEFGEAMRRGDRRMAKWIVLRGHLALISPWAWSVVAPLLGKVAGWFLRGP
jgi:hypothetical protein